jgi:hypothetical protein
MPLIDNAQVTLRTLVPPGDSLVGAYPQSLFRIDRFHLPVAPDLHLIKGGQLVPCEGQRLGNESHERTLTVGSFFAFHVRNGADEPRELVLTVSGPTVDGPETQEASALLGTFAQEQHESEPSPNTERY